MHSVGFQSPLSRASTKQLTEVETEPALRGSLGRYTVSYEILNSDLDLDDEKLVRVVVGGVSMLGCGGAGDNRPDYQCDFTECNSSSQTVTADSSGNIAVVATYTNNSKDCDCDQSDPNGNCVKEDTGSAEWTPTKAALKFTLTQA